MVVFSSDSWHWSQAMIPKAGLLAGVQRLPFAPAFSFPFHTSTRIFAHVLLLLRHLLNAISLSVSVSSVLPILVIFFQNNAALEYYYASYAVILFI